MKQISIFDTTLRDGSQGAGISFSVEDKIKIAKYLDSFGVAYMRADGPARTRKMNFFLNRQKK